MSFSIVKSTPFAAAFVLLGGLVLSSPASAIDLWGHKILDQTGCCQRCPECDHCCRLDAELVDEDIPCFNVESKVICIPRVVFPWQLKKCRSCTSCDGVGCTNCVHNGAKTRRICVLKADKYTCPKCEYTWTPEKKACVTGCCDAAACDCDAAVDLAGTDDVDAASEHTVTLGSTGPVAVAPLPAVREPAELRLAPRRLPSPNSQ